MAVRQAEGDVGGAAGGVDAELLAQAADEGEDLQARGRHGADRHDEGVDDDVVGGDAEVGGAVDDLPGHLEADVGVLGDAGVVVGDGDDGDVVLLDEGEDELEALLLAGDGVDERAAVGGLEAGLERAGDARVRCESGRSTRPWMSSIICRISGGSVSLGLGLEL